MASSQDDLPVATMLRFTLTSAARQGAARLGSITYPSRKEIFTPNFIATTSRGAISHITPDVQAEHLSVGGVYMPVEDCMLLTTHHYMNNTDCAPGTVAEKVPPREPPVFQIPPLENVSRLRRFTAQPLDSLLVVGPRRVSPVDSPTANSDDTFAIYTSVGFRREKVTDYLKAVDIIGPDVVIGPADIVWAAAKSQRRIQKMSDRTEQWMARLFESRSVTSKPGPSIFAPLLPIPSEQQRYYLEALADRAADLSGLAVYDIKSLAGLSDSFSELVRLSLTNVASPHEILQQILLGIDLFTITFVTAASDAGIALSFCFPALPSAERVDVPAALGGDMFSSRQAVSQAPLDTDAGCACHACSTAKRSYVHHLLSAKEMTGWVLLQIHNHAVLDAFFAGIRRSIAAGTFEQDVEEFTRHYQAELPAQTAAGPRVRGYQYKSSGPNEQKRNPRAFDGDFHTSAAPNDQSEIMVEVDSSAVDKVEDADQLEAHRLGQQI